MGNTGAQAAVETVALQAWDVAASRHRKAKLHWQRGNPLRSRWMRRSLKMTETSDAHCFYHSELSPRGASDAGNLAPCARFTRWAHAALAA